MAARRRTEHGESVIRLQCLQLAKDILSWRHQAFGYGAANAVMQYPGTTERLEPTDIMELGCDLAALCLQPYSNPRPIPKPRKPGRGK